MTTEPAVLARVLLDLLATVNAAGIVHRDVKPQNVRLGVDGAIFLLDFGSARLDASSQLTRTGTTVGTPEYMPPELFVGPVYDPRVDLYGVGATLFECLAGRPPQTADSLAELAYLRSHEAIAPVSAFRPEVPLALAQVVDRCLARRPRSRSGRDDPRGARPRPPRTLDRRSAPRRRARARRELAARAAERPRRHRAAEAGLARAPGRRGDAARREPARPRSIRRRPRDRCPAAAAPRPPGSPRPL